MTVSGVDLIVTGLALLLPPLVVLAPLGMAPLLVIAAIAVVASQPLDAIVAGAARVLPRSPFCSRRSALGRRFGALVDHPGA